MKAFSRAPLRIGIAGGGTDLDVYYKKFGGNVVNTTISLFMHCEIELLEDNDKIIFESIDLGIKLEYDCKTKIVFDGSMDLYKAIYNKIVSRYLKKKVSIKLITKSDVPMGSGLGGSSTLVVAIIKAFDVLFNLGLDKRETAELAYEIERNDINIAGGYQDQYTASFGGFNIMYFNQDKSIEVKKLEIEETFLKNLEDSTLLYYTNISRKAHHIEKEKSLLINSEKSIESMHKIKNDALRVKDAIKHSDLKNLANLLNETWKNKKAVSSLVSNRGIDDIYDLAIKNGALGAKISGAGGGGFIFFIIDSKKSTHLQKVLSSQDGKIFPFNFVENGVIGWKEQ